MYHSYINNIFQVKNIFIFFILFNEVFIVPSFLLFQWQCCYMQTDLQEVGLPPASFRFAPTVFALWLPEELLWKASVVTANQRLSSPHLRLACPVPPPLFTPHNSPLSGRATVSVTLLSSFSLVPSVLYLMEINPRSCQMYALVSYFLVLRRSLFQDWCLKNLYSC